MQTNQKSPGNARSVSLFTVYIPDGGATFLHIVITLALQSAFQLQSVGSTQEEVINN